MGIYEKGMAILEERFGGGKDNVIGLATIALEAGEGGRPRPVVRDVDAMYEDGAFYVVTYGQSAKMRQIEANDHVALAVNFEWFNAGGRGESLGWVMKPENAEIRGKVRKAFEKWYDMANNEKDENCCILKVAMSYGTININHHETLILMDFEGKSATLRGKEI
ncbi:MAG: pyridoxamine 5'-phosphate oxidase family protein [Oscillospiraceae bacterium]|nr:pyridoxamine 5'-phosphate oxidase family protein [Oscillospiraceae bacterium]